MCVMQVETNVKLEECLKKVQQENEDYRARMDKHAALSKYVFVCVRVFSHDCWLSSLSPPAGSCPVNKPSSSRRCRKSPRSTSVCPWRTRSCCGNCITATCWPAPVTCPPPHPSAHPAALHPYHPGNPATSSHPCAVLSLLITFVSLGRTEVVPHTETAACSSPDRLWTKLY